MRSFDFNPLTAPWVRRRTFRCSEPRLNAQMRSRCTMLKGPPRCPLSSAWRGNRRRHVVAAPWGRSHNRPCTQACSFLFRSGGRTTMGDPCSFVGTECRTRKKDCEGVRRSPTDSNAACTHLQQQQDALLRPSRGEPLPAWVVRAGRKPLTTQGLRQARQRRG